MEIEGKRLVLGYSEERVQRDKKMRELIIEKIRKNIEVSGISGVMKSQYKKYLNIKEKAKLDEEKIEEASRWDGYFGFYTNNRELSGKEVIKAYKLLWQVQDSFRSLKTTLKLRPIYHWTGKRIKGHIMMCFISFYILRYIEIMLNKNGINITAEKAIEELNEIRSIDLVTNNKSYIVRTEISGMKTKIFRALSVKIPRTVISETEITQD